MSGDQRTEIRGQKSEARPPTSDLRPLPLLDLPTPETIRRFSTVQYEVVSKRARAAKRSREFEDAWRFEGELPLKVFLGREAARLGITDTGVYRRMLRGKYYGLVRRSENQRRVFVRVGVKSRVPEVRNRRSEIGLTSDL